MEHTVTDNYFKKYNMKINLERIEIFADLAKSRSAVVDMRELIANLIYEKGSGLACSVLAHKIYEHREEMEFDDGEMKILRAVAESFLAPAACDALTALLDNSKHD